MFSRNIIPLAIVLSAWSGLLQGCGSKQYYDAVLVADSSPSQAEALSSVKVTDDGLPAATTSPSPTPTAPCSTDQAPSTDIVECEIGSASTKVILSEVISESSSNASRSRICMSEHSCLDLINAYAADRGCTLAVGAATSAGSTASCAKIFPGSKGTCHNARLLSDTEVQAFLSAMAQK